VEAWITKGTRVRARWLKADPNGTLLMQRALPFGTYSLAGQQMKLATQEVAAVQMDVVGVVTHVYGKHPNATTADEIIVRPDLGGEEVSVKPGWIVAVGDACPPAPVVL
jgi:hypothetical protein